MSHIKPFKIAVSDNRIQRLKQKLALADFPDEIVDAEDPWARGAPLSEVRRLAQYWATGFDWRKIEAELNQLPQFNARITVDGFDTYDVHFIHHPGTTANSLPLLFIHGWPGSFIEVTKMLPGLVKGGEQFPAFDVVAPSLVNFGLSSACKKSGFGIDQQAEMCHKLMLSLGFKEYIIQAGDLGYLVARFMAQKYGPVHVRATHFNATMPAAPNETVHPKLHGSAPTESDLIGLQRTERFQKEGSGYLRLLSTKPQTIGYSLSDSPIGLLAWLYEKLHDWSDSYAWTDDEILTWVSIYYFSEAGPAASSYLYYEMDHCQPEAFTTAQKFTDVPLGIARFENELILLPSTWNQTLGPVVRETVFERGGHFAAWERPHAIAGELRAMFGRGGPAEGCIAGRDGSIEQTAFQLQ